MEKISLIKFYLLDNYLNDDRLVIWPKKLKFHALQFALVKGDIMAIFQKLADWLDWPCQPSIKTYRIFYFFKL